MTWRDSVVIGSHSQSTDRSKEKLQGLSYQSTALPPDGAWKRHLVAG